MQLSELLDAAEQAIGHADYEAAAQHLQAFHRELATAVEESVEYWVKATWTEWRDEQMREEEREFDALKIRALKLRESLRVK